MDRGTFRSRADVASPRLADGAAGRPADGAAGRPAGGPAGGKRRATDGAGPAVTTVFRPASVSLAWTALIGNVVVVLQGAVVRATGSGAGCGSHWPTCQGDVIPLDPSVATLIEFSHRLLTMVVFLLGVWLLVRAWRSRRSMPGFTAFATASFVFLLVEAGIGAATVLFGLTGDNATLARGLVVAFHLVNSLLLVGCLTGTVVFARADAPAWPLPFRRQGLLSGVLGFGLIGMVVLIFTGGIAAMGNTMFPAESLLQGIAADFDPTSHLLIRLRILHPLIAISIGVYLFVALGLGWWLKPAASARGLARTLFGVYVIQLVLGTANLAFLAPIPLQLLHLATAVVAFALLFALSLTMLGSPISAVRLRAATTPRMENV